MYTIDYSHNIGIGAIASIINYNKLLHINYIPVY